MNGNHRILCEIANHAFNIVSRLLDRDQRMSREMRSAQTASRQIVREESITLEMATSLRERFPEHVEVTLFTAPEEARNGADWYWRIQKADGSIHARVQAKRIQRAEFGEPDSQGSIEIDKLQLDRLIKAVESDQQQLPNLRAWLATYARYDAVPPCGLDPSRCLRHGCAENCNNRAGIPSIWMANADEFHHSGGIFSIRSIVEKSLRLDCILPCTDGGSGIGPNIKGFTLNSNLPPYGACTAAIRNSPVLRQEFEGALLIKA